jgi:hypothetical protein
MALKGVLRALLHLLQPLGVYAGLYLGFELDGAARTAL